MLVISRVTVSALQQLLEIYITVSFPLKKLKFSNVMDLVKCHTERLAESGFKQEHIQLQTSHYSSSILHSSLRIITARSCGQKTPLTAVDGFFVFSDGISGNLL